MQSKRTPNIIRFITYQLLLAVMIVIILGEFYMRFGNKVNAMLPEALKERSLEYEPSIFAFHIFPQKEQAVIDMYWLDRWGNPNRFINDKGYRGANFEVKKNLGTVRTIIYGGSSVFDLAMPEGKDWPHRIERYLKNDGYENVEIINAGIPGHSSYDALGRLYAEGHHFQPDYVIFYGSWNDIKRFGSGQFLLHEIKPYEPKSNPLLYSQNPIDQFLAGRSFLYVFLRQTYLYKKYNVGLEGAARREKKVYKINPQAVAQFRLSLQLFVDTARNIGAQPVLMTEGRLIEIDNKKTDAFRLRHVENFMPYEFAYEAYIAADEVIRLVAKEKDVPLIDVALLMKERGEVLYFDHVHLADEGSKRIASIVTEKMKELIDSRIPTTALNPN